MVSAWIGLFLLMFNVVAGGALPASAAQPVTPDDHLIVCTAGGMAVIDRNGTPVSPDHAGENGFCGACLPFLHGAVITPAAALLPTPLVQPVPCAPLADAEPANVARPLRLAYPRAPPQA
ncbi:MAG TPA: DUF2946 family protein [Magnetospirillum sp.]|nr:DUF2946 family protein [Magnetospirillum sp.]